MSTQTPAKSRSFMKDAASVFSSKIAKIALTFVAGVLLARLLGPEGKGILSTVLIYPSLILSLSELGVRQAAIYHLGKGIHEERDVVGTVMFLLVVSSLFGVAICTGIYLWVDNPNITVPMMALALATIPLTLSSTFSQGILLGKEQIGEFSQVSWASPLLRLVGVLVFVWLLSWGIVGALLGSLITGGVMSVYILWLVARKTPLNFQFNLPLSKELLSLGFVYAIALFVIGLNYKVDIVILERLASPEDIGQYTLGVGIAELLWQLPAALGIVVFSRSANAKDPAAFTQNVLKLLRVTFLAAVAGALVLGLVAGLFIPLVYGEAYRPSVGVLRLLLPGIIAFSIFRVVNVDLAGRGRPAVALWSVAPAVALNVVLNFVLIPRYSIEGAAVASTLSYTAAVIFYTVAYARVVEVPLMSVFRYRRSDFAFLNKVFGRKVV